MGWVPANVTKSQAPRRSKRSQSQWAEIAAIRNGIVILTMDLRQCLGSMQTLAC